MPEVDQWIEGARTDSDPKNREALYGKVVDRVLEDLPMMYLVNVNYLRMYKKGLVGYEPSPQEYIQLFKNVKWE